jgi:hypothetical protein
MAHKWAPVKNPVRTSPLSGLPGPGRSVHDAEQVALGFGHDTEHVATIIRRRRITHGATTGR